jgi:hypothetical protein
MNGLSNEKISPNQRYPYPTLYPKHILKLGNSRVGTRARIPLNPPCSEAAFLVNSEPHTVRRPSVRVCVGLKQKKTGKVVVVVDNAAAESSVNRLLHSEARRFPEGGRKVLEKGW